MKEQISNEGQAIDMITEINRLPRAGWIVKGRRAKSNEKIEIARELAKELAFKTLCFYQVLDQLPYDTFCNCRQIEALLQNAIQELPAGDTVDGLEQIIFRFCLACGKKFEEVNDAKCSERSLNSKSDLCPTSSLTKFSTL